MKKRLVVLTGAGISAESGIKTFRGSDGLWEGYNILDVATPDAWAKDPVLVQQFYNERRAQVLQAKPNEAHRLLVDLEDHFDVHVITQNIDDLHERAGSTNIMHLHGIITYAQSSQDANLIYPLKSATIEMGAYCELGSQLRPHVVWFGEAVPMIENAAVICEQADVFMVVGTSLAVYPAAGLIDFVLPEAKKYIIDPVIPPVGSYRNIIKVEKIASLGLKEILNQLIADA
ncbi:MAG: NAD-dependent deacylase [Flavobacteriales bacterium]|nr:MAG: NAD-dependent deacylase [Flavobacteriales bacterium]